LTENIKSSHSLWSWIFIFIATGFPAVILRFSGLEIPAPLAAIVFGIGIVGGAFLLSWAAEVAQLDISASLAIAVLALIAILPEYAIEAVLAMQAGASFNPEVPVVTEEMSFVAANVTGANRLLMGLGWSAVILIYWLKRKQPLDMRGFITLELPILAVATLLSLIIFFTQQVHILLAVVLIALFLYYLWVSSFKESEEPELIGAAALLGSLATRYRRAWVIFLFVYAAAIILVAAEPFVESLIHSGESLGISKFLLIQWLAPLASESPEILVAILFTLRANPVAGLTALISSQVNQLTLLIGSMVIIFMIAAPGNPLSFPLNHQQSVEFLLTTAMSVFAIMLIAPRIISWKAGAILLVLFVTHIFFTDPAIRLIFTYIFFGLSGVLVVMNWRRVLNVFGRGTD
jgi:cation:H+ antiporter